ncbi:hypothetical protein ACFVXH_35345 [Kitasatospora sp. NPDC058184]|uniref:hypothetical protein n=1 Tax=Kitasatospora sp. NPDC058184 TaxID=3346370 RepID=UPI0036DC23D0
MTGQPGSSASTHPEPGETCVDLLTRLTPYTEVITWQDGTKSTIAWTSVEATLSGATATGTVMSGHYLGDSATKVVDALSFTGTNPELCPLGDGTVSGVSGTVALTIESL